MVLTASPSQTARDIVVTVAAGWSRRPEQTLVQAARNGTTQRRSASAAVSCHSPCPAAARALLSLIPLLEFLSRPGSQPELAESAGISTSGFNHLAHKILTLARALAGEAKPYHLARAEHNAGAQRSSPEASFESTLPRYVCGQ